MLVRTATTEVTDPVLLAWLERLQRVRRDPKTLRNVRVSFRRAQEFLDEQGVTAAEAEPWLWDEWFSRPEAALGTRKKQLADVRAAYRYAQRRGVLTSDPTFDVEFERVPDEEPVIVPNARLREMKASVWDERGILLFHLLAYTGMRRSEIRELLWSAVDLEEGVIKVLGKAGKLREVPIHPALGEQLAHYRRDAGYVIAPSYEAFSDRAISEGTMRRLVEEFAGEYTPHSFRRTVASSMYENEVPDWLIDEIMGWAPRKVGHKFYKKVSPAKLQRAILKLYSDDPV